MTDADVDGAQYPHPAAHALLPLHGRPDRQGPSLHRPAAALPGHGDAAGERAQQAQQ
ncbi:MAG: hypothetical protein R2851_05300 [Caldilineaceae bacterium]